MVRLKLVMSGSKIEKALRLNSTMVRLKQTNSPLIVSIVVTSQFHYGSIKTSLKDLLNNVVDASQFHYSSIKTQFRTETFKRIFKSQFHYGSIKTVPCVINGFPIRTTSIPLWFD